MADTITLSTEPILVPNMLNPDIVPGGTIADGQWRKLQQFVNQVGDTLNQTIVLPPPAPVPVWNGQAAVITSLGVHNLAVDDYNVFLSIGGSAGVDLTLYLPTLADVLGPITIWSGDDTFYTVNTQVGDDIEVVDVRDGGASVDVTVSCGVSDGAALVVLMPHRDNPNRWVLAQVQVTGIN